MKQTTNFALVQTLGGASPALTPLLLTRWAIGKFMKGVVVQDGQEVGAVVIHNGRDGHDEFVGDPGENGGTAGAATRAKAAPSVMKSVWT